MKPESVAVNVDTDQTIPNATESDNLMNESHSMEKEVSLGKMYNVLMLALHR